MKIQKKQTVSENLLYVMVWATIILVPVLNAQMMSEIHIKFENVLIAWRQIAPYFIIFAIHNGILAPRLMLRRKYVTYVASNLALITGIFGMVYLYEQHIATQLPTVASDVADTYRKASFSNLEIYWNIVLGFFMTGANTGIKLIYQSMRDEQKMEELKRQNLQAEMDYLKYQINPHFFMNTLNNIHALIDIDTETAKSAVIELSKMMRYVLYESGREIISLEQDIRFLRNYVALMRIRYPDDIDIRIDAPEALPQVSIPPLLLIVFVENAFKHGMSYNRRSFIHIDIRYADGRVVSRIANSRPAPRAGHKPGIGLENVRKRLSLIYGEENYTLSIREEADTYTAELSIPTLHA